MKRTLTFPILAFFAALLFFSLVELGQAGSISVGTYDSSTGLVKDNFYVGEEVRIKASSNAKPITITVTYEDGTVVHTETWFDYNYDKILPGLTEKSGWYTVEASSPIDKIKKNYASTYFHVVPEIPFGTLGTIATISLGLFFYKKMRHTSLDLNLKLG